MQFIKSDINLDFIGKRKIAFFFSIGLIIITIASLIFHDGPKLGIDFEGGALIQVRFDSPVKIDDIKTGLQSVGLESSSVQDFSEESANEFLIRTESPRVTGEGFASNLKEALDASVGAESEIRRMEMVGPQVGRDLREKALLAMFYALLGITFYISGRFEFKWLVSGGMGLALILAVYLFKVIGFSIPLLIVAALMVTLILFWFLDLRYAMGAIVALIHDVLITVGVFSILEMEFTLPIIAALLTIIGYSLNDTIIVFDRIRENMKKHHKKPLDFIINRSINETLGRTILTSMTTLFVVVTLFLLGGGIIHDFAFALIVGVIIGTYSSLYVASPILLTWELRKKK
ncbi:MAG: protein translocase subunit SecF [Deltaproteobacteria bacterium]|jgi:preprotein translocase subunit SecF|nr:protein translocase subunit SecF [Deltaproteobacteria bacterium]